MSDQSEYYINDTSEQQAAYEAWLEKFRAYIKASRDFKAISADPANPEWQNALARRDAAEDADWRAYGDWQATNPRIRL